jgi:hypothetical protein
VALQGSTAVTDAPAAGTEEVPRHLNAFVRYIGIDYSGAEPDGVEETS